MERIQERRMGRQRISEARLLGKSEAVLGYQKPGLASEKRTWAFSSWLWHTAWKHLDSGNGWA